MNEGRVLQVGTPQELFEVPRHTFVGYFIGSPGMNFLACTLDGEAAAVDGARIALAPGLADKARQRGGRLLLGVRPGSLRLMRGRGNGAVPVDICDVEDLGLFKIVTARLGSQVIKVKLSEQDEVPVDAAALVFSPETTRLYADDELVG
jgi:glycerol transport system ATP-binding protein